MLARQCDDYHTLPLAGGLLDQPLGVLADMAEARAYQRAYQLSEVDYKEEPEKCPPWALELLIPVVEYMTEQAQTPDEG